jgi:hypothetical protein
MGMTLRLAVANEDLFSGALCVAWQLRVEKNRKSGKKARIVQKASPAKIPPRKKR